MSINNLTDNTPHKPPLNSSNKTKTNEQKKVKQSTLLHKQNQKDPRIKQKAKQAPKTESTNKHLQSRSIHFDELKQSIQQQKYQIRALNIASKLIDSDISTMILPR
ncbi:MAG: hypothetical protein HRT72_03620 [Flavobacteriales bacterium]|nr:hypothetical protein [Flavobacteriales bacterium]